MNYQTLSNKYLQDTIRKFNIPAGLNIFSQNLKNFHWRVQGPNFFELHKKFEEMYLYVNQDIDMLAERVLALKSIPISLFSEYLLISEVEEAELYLNTEEMLEKVLHDLEVLNSGMKFLISYASDHRDEATVDMLVSMVSKFDKEAWMFRAYLGRVGEAIPEIE